MVKTEINKEKPKPKPMQQQTLSTKATSNEKKKKYKGVRMRSWGSWVSEIRAPNQKTRIWLGSYSTAEAAARAYDAALLCLKGSSATNLNFPLESSSHFIPQENISMSPKLIQRVAAAAAAASSSNNDVTNTITISTPPTSPPNPTSTTTTSSSLVSSPSMSSSPSDQIDDDVSLFSSLGAYTTSCDDHYQANDQSMAMMDSWYGFDGLLQSPKHVDQMLSGSLFDIDSTQVLLDDWYEEGDISLWSFY